MYYVSLGVLIRKGDYYVKRKISMVGIKNKT